MQVHADDTLVFEIDDDEIVRIEGNAYVPKSGLTDAARLEESPTQYTCGWKGDATYWNLVIGDTTITDAAWSYEQPYESSFERVGTDYSGHVAFDRTKLAVS